MAPEEQDRLFQALAQEVLNRLTAGHCTTCGRSAATHQELQIARQFLADNGITAGAGSARLHSITDRLPFKDPDRVAGIAGER